MAQDTLTNLQTRINEGKSENKPGKNTKTRVFQLMLDILDTVNGWLSKWQWDIDANGKRITNLLAAVSATEPVRKGEFDAQIATMPIYNLSFENNKYDYTSATARSAVPVGIRKLGLIITYATVDLWIEEKYVGSNISGWVTSANWTTPNLSNYQKGYDKLNLLRCNREYATASATTNPFYVEIQPYGSNEICYRNLGSMLIQWQSTGNGGSVNRTIIRANKIIAAGTYILEFDSETDSNYLSILDTFGTVLYSYTDNKVHIKIPLILPIDRPIGQSIFLVQYSATTVPKNLQTTISNVSLYKENNEVLSASNSLLKSAILTSGSFELKKEMAKVAITEYYIDSVSGSDSNDGSILTPFKSLSKIVSGIPVKYNLYNLKCGSEFYESVELKNYIILRSYGVGNKPKLKATRNLYKGCWTLYDALNNIYVANLTDAGMTGRGLDLIGMNLNSNYRYSVGAIINNDTNEAYQPKSNTLDLLASSPDWTMFQAGLTELASISSSTFNQLYLKSSSNPNLKNLSVSLSYILLSSCTHIDVSGLELYGAMFGTECSDSYFTNMQFDVIGGQIYLPNTLVAIGNAIDIWNKSGCVAVSCKFKRTFDAAYTPQTTVSSLTQSVLKDNVCYNSIFYRNSNSFECFHRYGIDRLSSGIYDNCKFENNVCIYDGNTKMTDINDQTKGSLLLTDYTFSNAEVKNNLFILPDVFIRSHTGGGAILKNNRIFIQKGKKLYYFIKLPVSQSFDITLISTITHELRHSDRLKIGDTFQASCKLTNVNRSLAIRIAYYNGNTLISTSVGTWLSENGSTITHSGVVPANTTKITIDILTNIAVSVITLNEFYLRSNGKIFKVADILANTAADIVAFNELFNDSSNEINIMEDTEVDSIQTKLWINSFL